MEHLAQRVKSFFIAHKWAILLAIFVSILSAMPQIYFRMELKEQGVYQGIELLGGDAWLPRIKEVQDGHLNWGSIYYKDGKDLPYLFQPLGAAITAYLGMTFGLGINNTVILSNLILPSIVFLLIYTFILLLSGRKLISITGALAIVLAISVASVHGLVDLLRGSSPHEFLWITRPGYSAVIHLFFYGFLISFWQFYRTKNWKWGVLSSILLGLTFYSYFYTWTYLYAFLSVLGLICLVRKEWREAIRVACVGAGGVVVGIPWFLNLLAAMQHPVYHDISVRGGLVVSHMPLFIGFVPLGVLIFFLVAFPRQDKEKYFFSLALLLTPIVTMNQQILTGKWLQSAHYHWHFHKAIALIFAIWIVYLLLDRFFEKTVYKKIFATLAIGGALYAGIFTQVSSYRELLPQGILEQRYGPVIDWFNANVEKEAVVLSNEFDADLVVTYTSLNVFHHTKAPLTLAAPESRVLDVLFTYYRIKGIDKNTAREIFHGEERKFISTRVYGIYYRQALGAYEAVPDEKIDRFTDLYLETLKTPTAQWLEGMLRKYEVEYILWDKKADPTWKLEQLKFLKKEQDYGELVIYSVIPEKKTNE